MLRALAFFILAALPVTAMAEDAEQPKEVVQVHGHALPLSCAEWRRNQDGTWTNTSALLVGTEIVKEVTLRGAKETGALETKCYGSAVPAAAPQHEAGHTKKHRQGTQSPANGT